MNEVLINKSSDINLIKNLKLKDVSKKSISNLNYQSKYIIQNIISETIFDNNNKEDENFINEKVLVQRKIECWNCNYIIISNPEWDNVQCTNCNNINIVPDISFEEFANNKTFKNFQKHLEFINIECIFCKYIMITKKESKYLICNKCKNTIIIDNTNFNHILNPYLNNTNICNELKSIKKIINPLNKKNGLLENIFNPMLDSNVIEKEFEMFLRIVAKREFEKWKLELQNKEKELSLKYFEGYKKSEIINEICKNTKNTEQNSYNKNNFILLKKQNNQKKNSKYSKSYLLDRIKYNIHDANKNIVNPVMLPLIVKKN